jgi:hypothetical protein
MMTSRVRATAAILGQMFALYHGCSVYTTPYYANWSIRQRYNMQTLFTSTQCVYLLPLLKAPCMALLLQ